MSLVELVGIPYEGPDDFLKGTSLAPAKIRWAMNSIEDYSIYKNSRQPPFLDRGDIIVPSEPDEAFKIIEETLNKIIRRENKYLFLGGNHFITLPIVKIFREIYKDFYVVHFDAHLDKRDEHMGMKLSNATVMRRIEEIIGEDRIFTFGYRSLEPQEEKIGRNSFPFRVYEPLREVIGKLDGKIYLTIDLDVLDPSEFPAVSYPEAGGISFKELIDSVDILRGKLIACDVVEFNPLASPILFPSVTASLLVRELLIILAS